MSRITRRDFTKSATVGAAGLTALSASRVHGANDRVRVGFIGLGNRGDQVLSAFLTHKDCEVPAICDIHQPYLDFAAKKIGTNPLLFNSYEKLLARNDLDAVAIETPDHWHALMMIAACKAGKDVYVEKPLSLCVAEGRKMVEAARQYKRVVQVGIQRLSSSLGKEVAEYLQGGGIGKVMVARAFHVQNEWPKGIGNPPDSEPPPGFDWDAWQGPAPAKPYNMNRTFYRFRWFYDYSGGQLTNFGVHYIASIHWALNLEAPTAVTAMGGKYVNYDNREVPDTMEVLWHYPGDTLVSFTQYNASAAPAALRNCEIEFRGTKGTLYLNSNGYEVVPEVITPNEFAARDPTNRDKEKGWRTGAKAQIAAKKAAGKILDADHARNFLDCVKSRKTPTANIHVAVEAARAAHLGNLALKQQRRIKWDAQRERIES
jgi:predicted dehydrogenase